MSLRTRTRINITDINTFRQHPKVATSVELVALYIPLTLRVGLLISRFDMSCAQAHWVGSKPIFTVMQLKLHKPTVAIGYSLRMGAQNVDSTNPGRSNLVFRPRSKSIAEAEMSNRLICCVHCPSGYPDCPPIIFPHAIIITISRFQP